MADAVFSRDLSKAKGHTLHYGNILKGSEVLDEAVAAVFRAPRSYTREDVIEFSCHGSPYILREVLLLLVENGARLAEPGEFTRRAYLSGAMDLAQAEAVADLIASTSAGAHQIAMNQLRGGVSRELKDLREQLLNFTSLIELELDFSEEDVEFADRSQLQALTGEMMAHFSSLIDSFRLGNALRQGVPTVIVGKPNAGKSTLLNALLEDNRAIVSDIPGTTRDVIEDRLHIGGIEFRLMDTAGLRHTSDIIEAEGVNRSLELAQKAQVLIYVFDAVLETPQMAQEAVAALGLPEGVEVVLAANKLDQIADSEAYVSQHDVAGLKYAWLGISAKTGYHLNGLRTWMVDTVRSLSNDAPGQVIISHARHIQALQQARKALLEVEEGLRSGLTGDLLSIDIRTVLHHLGSITGDISTEEILGNIFSKFCIGK